MVMPDLLTITLNGEPRRMPAGTTVADVVENLNLAPDQVAVELNRRLVRSGDYGRALADGDAVEVVTFVGGG